MSAVAQWKFDKICKPEWIPEDTRVINELDLGAALTGELALDPLLKSLFVYNSNLVSQGPAQAKLVLLIPGHRTPKATSRLRRANASSNQVSRKAATS